MKLFFVYNTSPTPPSIYYTVPSLNTFSGPSKHTAGAFFSPQKSREKNNLQNAPAFTDYNLNRVKTWHALFQRAKVNRVRFPLARTDKNPSLKENKNDNKKKFVQSDCIFMAVAAYNLQFLSSLRPHLSV